MDLDVDSMRAYLTVLDRGSMTDAARVLDLTQSAVSHRMKRLEARVGQDLLVRDGRSLRPTRAGRAILDDARAMVEAHDRAAARLATADLTGRVRIGAHEDIGIDHLTRLLGSFARTHPGADVAFTIGGSAEISTRLDAGDFDIALVETADSHLRDEDRILWSERPIWVCARSQPFAGDPVPFVAYSEHCLYRIEGEKRLRQAGVDYRVPFTIPNTAGALAAIRDGLGVSVMAPTQISDDVAVWKRAESFAPMPVFHHVVRTVPGDISPAADMLTSLVERELQRDLAA